MNSEFMRLRDIFLISFSACMRLDCRSFVLVAIASLTLVAHSSTALAACASPVGNEGEMIYNDDFNVAQFCNGTSWVSMSGGASAGAESDPQVGMTTLNKWCRGDGSSVVCDLNAPLTTEVDPKIGTLTNTKWCTTDGTTITCTANAPAAGTPGGADTQVQFNDGGVFGGDPDFVWNKTTNRLGIGNTPSTELEVTGTVKASGPFWSAFGSTTTLRNLLLENFESTAVANGSDIGIKLGGTEFQGISWVKETAWNAASANGVKDTMLQFGVLTDNVATVPMVVRADGSVGIGTTVPGYKLEVRDGDAAVLNEDGWKGFKSVTAGSAANWFSGLYMYNSRGTIAAPTATQSGDRLGQLRWYGYGTGFSNGSGAAEIRAVAEGAFTAGNHPTAMVFSTAAATASTERMRIDASGNVGIGTSTLLTDARLTVMGAGAGNYNAIKLANVTTDATAKGGIITGARYTNTNVPFVGFGVWDSNAARQVYMGGSAWNAPDATMLRFFAAPAYDESIGTGANERMRITGSGAAINTEGTMGNPAASAALDIVSTTKGFLPPRMTTAQRDAIATPTAGLRIHNTDTGTTDVFTTAAGFGAAAWEINGGNLRALGRGTSGNYNTITGEGPGGIWWMDGPGSTNGPTGTNSGVLMHFDPLYYSAATKNKYAVQFGTIGGGSGALYFREQNNGTWSAWNQLTGGGGGGTPGGANTNVQFNSGGGFGGDASFVWDNTNKRLGIGVAAPDSALHLEGTSYAASQSKLVAHSATILLAPELTLAKTRGSATTIVNSGDRVGIVGFRASDGVDTNSYTASIESAVDGTPGADDMPGRLEFKTTADGSATPTTRMTIKADGNVGIGTTGPSQLLDAKRVNETYGTAAIIGGQVNAAGTAVPAVPTFVRAGVVGYGFHNYTSSSHWNVGVLGYVPPGGHTATAGLFYAPHYNGVDWTTTGRVARFIGADNANMFIGQINQSTQAVTRADLYADNVTGNVGIGTTGPASKLEVEIPGTLQQANGILIDYPSGYPSSSALAITMPSYAGSSRNLIEASSGASGGNFIVRSDGNVGIGMTPSGVGTKLDVNGGIKAADGSQIIIGTWGTSGLQLIGQAGVQALVGSMDSVPLIFRTASSEKMRIEAGGNVAIGATSAISSSRLTVQFSAAGGGPAGLELNETSVAGSGGYFIRFRANGTTIGSVGYSGTSAVVYNTTSDKRLKEHIEQSEIGLETLMRIEVSDYNFIADPAKKRLQGFVAQQLATVYPEAVTEGGDDPTAKPWGVDYGRLTPLLVKSVQELKAANDNLEAENEQLLGALNELRSRVEKLEYGK